MGCSSYRRLSPLDQVEGDLQPGAQAAQPGARKLILLMPLGPALFEELQAAGAGSTLGRFRYLGGVERAAEQRRRGIEARCLARCVRQLLEERWAERHQQDQLPRPW